MSRILHLAVHEPSGEVWVLVAEAVSDREKTVDAFHLTRNYADNFVRDGRPVPHWAEGLPVEVQSSRSPMAAWAKAQVWHVLDTYDSRLEGIEDLGELEQETDELRGKDAA